MVFATRWSSFWLFSSSALFNNLLLLLLHVSAVSSD
jgi:hypothetical protein